MDNVLVIICFLAAGVLIGILIGLVILVAGGNSQKGQPAVLAHGGEGKPTWYGSPTSYARGWHLDFWDPLSNRIFSKDFCGQIILGRGSGEQELFWQLRVGDDPTVSREQCVIYDRGGFLVIENLSQVNVTCVNSVQITRPTLLQQGNLLTMGNSTLYLTNVQRTS